MPYVSDSKEAFLWVDDYFSHIRPHFDIREADNLLIVLPNRAVRLNKTALRILTHLKRGGSIHDIARRLEHDPARRYEAYCFLCDFRSLMSGCLGEGRGRKAVETIPHSIPFNTLPVLSEIALTYRCNLSCRFCYAACGCRRTPQSRDEMSTDQVGRMLHIIRHDAGVPSVSFTGGEPLMRDDLEQLVARAVETDLRVNLITNATLLAGNDRALRLRSAGLTSAQVSLEGPNSDVHDELTTVPGSFERTIQGLAALRDAGIHVHTNTTLSSTNAPYAIELVRFVSSLGLDRMSMNLVIPTGSATSRLQVPYSNVWEIIEPARAEARRHEIDFMWYSPTPMCIMNPLANGMGNKSCAACDGLLSISPCGDILPCSSYAEAVGNLLSQPFSEIWQSARATFFRNKEYAPAECAGCEEFAACAGACPLYWSALGTGELAAQEGRTHATA